MGPWIAGEAGTKPGSPTWRGYLVPHLAAQLRPTSMPNLPAIGNHAVRRRPTSRVRSLAAGRFEADSRAGRAAARGHHDGRALPGPRAGGTGPERNWRPRRPGWPPPCCTRWGSGRADADEYPADALRELVLNALAHRDYLLGDRCESSRPGGWGADAAGQPADGALEPQRGARAGAAGPRRDGGARLRPRSRGGADAGRGPAAPRVPADGGTFVATLRGRARPGPWTACGRRGRSRRGRSRRRWGSRRTRRCATCATSSPAASSRRGGRPTSGGMSCGPTRADEPAAQLTAHSPQCGELGDAAACAVRAIAAAPITPTTTLLPQQQRNIEERGRDGVHGAGCVRQGAYAGHRFRSHQHEGRDDWGSIARPSLARRAGSRDAPRTDPLCCGTSVWLDPRLRRGRRD